MDKHKVEGRGVGMSGLGIFGIVLAVIGILVVVWGTTLTPISLTSPAFMSFVTGGAVLLAIGLCTIPGLPPAVRVASIWLAAVATAAYLWSLPDMELSVRLIGLVPLAALAVWLTTRFWK